MQPGDKVICVNSYIAPHTAQEIRKDVPNWVRKGETYTIREIVDFDFVVGLLLEEIKNPPIYFKAVDKVVEPTFLMSRFRKLETKKVNQSKRETVCEG
jgi:hypothetical protein